MSKKLNTMSKKLWDLGYLKPVDHPDILSSENIDKGRKMHEAISKRMKKLIGSFKNGDVFSNTSAEAAKLQMSGRQLRTEKIPVNKKYDIDFVNFSFFEKSVDLKAKTVKQREEQVNKPKPNQKNDSYSFEVGVPPGYGDQPQPKEEPTFSTCSSCNFINEYIDYDPEYKCLKCRNGW